MGVEIALNTPLADALNSVIQPKLVDIGWSTGGVDDSALSEYIILMLVNRKTQDQIAAELAGDLLNLGPDDPGAIDFSSWLFQQLETLNEQLNGRPEQPSVASTTNGSAAPTTGQQTPHSQTPTQPRRHNGGQNDTEMGDGQESHPNGQMCVHYTRVFRLAEERAEMLTRDSPTEPKSMRNGNRNKRMLGQVSKAMDRSTDGVLHKVRSQHGTERINGHQRDAPKGPRLNTMRGHNMGIRPVGPMHVPGMPNSGPAAAMSNMSPQQQMQLFAMYEEQARVMSQILSPHQQQHMFTPPGFNPPMLPGGFGSPMPQSPGFGRSLFDRVQQRPGPRNGGFQQQRPSEDLPPLRANGPKQDRDVSMQPSSRPHPDLTSSMEVEPPQDTVDADPAKTPCRYNLQCTKEDCLFAHQSSEAPPGTAIDVADECTFGVACKNRKCVARHPSPAKKSTHQAEQDCKYFPNCTNPACSFRHPTMPLCRNGADCTRSGCKFTHLKTACRFTPCLNVTCPYKHAEGQKKAPFEDKVWVSDKLKEQSHVSERKFIDDAGGREELIIPASDVSTSPARVGTPAAGAEVTA